MLQIKKKCLLVFCKYNLKFLFRNKNLSKNYLVKKKVSKSIILRSPKHFNIGKQKILNLAYKTPSLLIKFNNKLTVNTLVSHHDLLLETVSKKLQLTPTVATNSVKFTIKTKFKIKWLVT